jgi:hypothetical protein
MFLKRSIGFIVYFIVILITRVYFEIMSDGIGIDDFSEILSYSIIAMLIISLLLLVIEVFVSFSKNKDVKFWKYFNFYSSLHVLLITLFLLFALYLIIPTFDTKSLILWSIVFLVGEILRVYYNKQIVKRK